MKKVKIIGVPEHFNLPWHLAIEEGAFENRGIDLEWTDIHEGTGRMAQMLSDGETDLAIILTEGIVKSITEGNQSKIAQTYVASPLLWGIHVAAKSKFKSISDLEGKKAAISRYGSGSHLMAYVNAKQQNWNTKELKFEIINNLKGAVKGLTEEDADYFMWEHFTTKPLVDNGVFRRLGDCPTLWPCFVIAVTNSFALENKGTLNHILEVINLYTEEFKMIPSIDRTLANRYSQKLEDIKIWLSKTHWGQSQLDVDTIKKIQKQLFELDLISEIKDSTELLT
ncbi:substrate-binding domain-containing protein [Croceitalea sp. MTPC9]|uniref:substrate-binding domain-containing protein n=1 Tax=unclassified Croceitalea TaxID=2632280 RepID=UPI002B3E4CAB|nr:substrate-binding domain-containing protein [Croceitalea sp. MTPC6]GMN15675.1 substrate-binding domain-containing protein [Croceitalea sp. MTPC9]